MKKSCRFCIVKLAVLTLAVAISLTGCNRNENNFDDSNSSSEISKEKQTVSFDDIRKYTALVFPEGSAIKDAKFSYSDDTTYYMFDSNGLYVCVNIPKEKGDEFISAMESNTEIAIIEQTSRNISRIGIGRDNFLDLPQSYDALIYMIQYIPNNTGNPFFLVYSHVTIIRENDGVFVHITSTPEFLRDDTGT